MISRGSIRKPRCSAPRPAPRGRRHLMVRPALGRRFDQLRADLDVLVAAAPIEVVVLHEHGRRKHDVGHERGFGHELLVHADEQVLPGEAPFDQFLLGRDRDRVGVLDQHGGDRRAVPQRLRVTGEDASDLGLVELAHLRVVGVEAFDEALAEVEDGVVVVKRLAALELPGARHGSNAGGGMHVHRPVALAAECHSRGGR